MSFKPYYKWITFNTFNKRGWEPQYLDAVLNLIINGLPSIRKRIHYLEVTTCEDKVLNLIINGLPSILFQSKVFMETREVLNLIINGLPSIQYFGKW